MHQAPPSHQPLSPAQQAPWQRQRFWFAPAAHALLHSALAWRTTAKGVEVALQTRTSCGVLSYLNDHQIQVMV